MKNVRILLFLLLLSPLAVGQSTTGLMPVIHQQFLDNLGTPLTGGFVYTYLSGTSTQHSSFKDSIGTLNTNPVVLDSGGYADIWLDNTAYRICVYTPSNVQQYCKDNITAAPPTLGLTYAQLSGGNTFLGGSQIIGPQGTATVSNNFGSHSFRLRASFWNGTVAANDDWLLVNKMGTGTNPTATLTLTHSGSAGVNSFDFSALGTSKLPSIDMTGKTLSNPAIVGSTITSSTLTGVSTGNSVTLLQAFDNAAAQAGTGGAANMFSYTLPANSLQANKALRFTIGALHSTGSAAVSYTFNFGGCAINIGSGTGAAGAWIVTVRNKSGSTTQQTFSVLGNIGSTGASNAGTCATDTKVDQTISVTFTVANTDQVTPYQLIETQIQ